MKEYALVADLGGTNIRTALLDREGRMSRRHSTPTLAQDGRDNVMMRLLGALEHVSSFAEADSIVGVGLSVASPTDPATGAMYGPPNLPGWDGYSPKPLLEERFSLRATVVNDATVAALAEYRYGAGRGHRHIIYMTVSTGIGGGVVVDGKLYTGSRGFAGEIGHITIDCNGPPCRCGNVGCLEAMCSGTAVARIARERLASCESSALLNRVEGDLDKVDALMVADAARSGDATAQAIMAEVTASLGTGIVSLLHAFDPDIIVIGGGMSLDLDMMLPGISRQIDLRAMAHHRGRLPVVRSQLGDDVSLLGTAALAFAAHDAAQEA